MSTLPIPIPLLQHRAWENTSTKTRWSIQAYYLPLMVLPRLLQSKLQPTVPVCIHTGTASTEHSSAVRRVIVSPGSSLVAQTELWNLDKPELAPDGNPTNRSVLHSSSLGGTWQGVCRVSEWPAWVCQGYSSQFHTSARNPAVPANTDRQPRQPTACNCWLSTRDLRIGKTAFDVMLYFQTPPKACYTLFHN